MAVNVLGLFSVKLFCLQDSFAGCCRHGSFPDQLNNSRAEVYPSLPALRAAHGSLAARQLWHMLLLLAGYANGCRRKRCADTKARLPQYLPEPTWFTERLREQGLSELLTRVPRAQHYSAAANVRSAVIEAAVRVQPGEIYSGPLTNWKQEAHLLWKYYGCPCASYSLCISDVWRLSSPATLSSARGHAGNLSLRHFCFQGNVAPVKDDAVLHRPSSPQDSQQLGDVMDHWGLQELRANLNDVPVLFLPKCVLELICKGQWPTIVLHADGNHRSARNVNLEALKFLRTAMSWPSMEDFMKICRQIGATATAQFSSFMLTEQRAQVLLDHVRAHAATNFQHLEQGENQAVQEAVQALQIFVDGFAKTGPEARASNAKKTAEELIASVSAAQSVRNRSKMIELQESLLTKFTPAELTDAVRQVVTKPSSGSSVSKNQVSCLFSGSFLFFWGRCFL